MDIERVLIITNIILATNIIILLFVIYVARKERDKIIQVFNISYAHRSLTSARVSTLEYKNNLITSSQYIKRMCTEVIQEAVFCQMCVDCNITPTDILNTVPDFDNTNILNVLEEYYGEVNNRKN